MGAALATGAADFIGGLFANKGNQREAQRNRDFQERMSSTAAQRAVKDYQAAGLNPALAYDRPSSSPGGSQAQVENPVGKAVSSAMAAAQLENIKASTDKMGAEAMSARADAAVKTFTQNGEPSYQEEQIALRKGRMAVQPHQVRAAALANEIGEFTKEAARLGIPKAAAEAAYWKLMGGTGVAVDQLSGPIGGLVGGGLGLAAILGKRGMATSSGAAASKLFKRPLPRREGDWERAAPKPVRKPRGFVGNSPP